MTEAYQRTPDMPQIEWVCTRCDRPILGSSGAVWISWESIREAGDNADAPPRPTVTATGEPILRTMADLLAEPDPPSWSITHDSCSLPEDDGYEIGVDELRTHQGVLAWTSHLYGKTWAPETNWDWIIRAAAHNNRVA